MQVPLVLTFFLPCHWIVSSKCWAQSVKFNNTACLDRLLSLRYFKDAQNNIFIDIFQNRCFIDIDKNIYFPVLQVFFSWTIFERNIDKSKLYNFDILYWILALLWYIFVRNCCTFYLYDEFCKRIRTYYPFVHFKALQSQ